MRAASGTGAASRLADAVLTDHRLPPRPISSRRLGGGLLVALLLVAACSGGGSSASDDEDLREAEGPNSVPLPTIEGGLDLPVVDPAAVLSAEGLRFGQPLPSEQVAADAFTEAPEVASALARRVLSAASTRLVGRVVVLTLDGPEIFDEGVLDGFVRGMVGAFGNGPVEEVPIGDQPTLRSASDAITAHGFRDGNLLVVATAPVGEDATLIVERQVAARAAGVVGSVDPVTPMRALPIDAAFVSLPTVTFQAIPPEEEPLPETPTLAGATAVQGRYGVVAGERRTTVWSFTVDPAIYPSAERLEPALAALVSARSGGTASTLSEVIDRAVLWADAAPGVDGALAARAFRHGALVILVEGTDARQVDAVVSDWISALV